MLHKCSRRAARVGRLEIQRRFGKVLHLGDDAGAVYAHASSASSSRVVVDLVFIMGLRV